MKQKLTTSQTRFKALHDGKAITCEVSDRYVALKVDANTSVAFGTPVWLDVMTNRHGSGADHKHCQLCVSLEELEKVVAGIRQEVETSRGSNKGADE